MFECDAEGLLMVGEFKARISAGASVTYTVCTVACVVISFVKESFSQK